MTRSTSRRRTVLASLATLALPLAACNSTVGGSPSAVSSPPASTGAPTSSTSGTDPFAGLSPCTLLDQAVKGEGYPPATISSGDSRHACDVDKPPYGTVGLQLQPGQKYQEIVGNTGNARTGDVNGRPAIQVRERLGNKGACEVFMEVKPGSRAIVGVNLVSRNTDEACTYVGQEATKIEPLLPK